MSPGAALQVATEDRSMDERHLLAQANICLWLGRHALMKVSYEHWELYGENPAIQYDADGYGWPLITCRFCKSTICRAPRKITNGGE